MAKSVTNTKAKLKKHVRLIESDDDIEIRNVNPSMALFC